MKRGIGVPTAAPVGGPGLQDQLAAVDDRRRRERKWWSGIRWCRTSAAAPTVGPPVEA